MRHLCRWAVSIFLGSVFSSWALAQVVPTVSITAPGSVSTGATYLVSVAAADTSGHLLNLNVTRNGVYWGSASAIAGDPTRYNLSVSGNDTAPTTPGTISFYAAVTSDSSSANSTATITVVDGTLPSVPTGLAATSLTTTGFTLNWTASTDNVGVTGYEVQRDATSLGTVAVTNKAITGLTPGLTYAMTVRARDAAANWSAWSTALNVTTLKANQAAVSITSLPTATYGTTYTATAAGGNGTGALVWALGTGSTASNAAINPSTGVITADSNGPVVINVYRAADINYNASAITANFTVTVAKRLITVTLSGTKVYDATTASTGASAAITTGTLAGSDTIGYAFAVTSSANAGTYSGLTTATISNTAAPIARSGSYTITYAGSYIITKANQSAVTITSSGAGTYGTAYTATASGGLGTGALGWALGSGSTASDALINAGTGAITTTSSGLVIINVYRAASTNYNVSATTANFTVIFAGRPITVTLAGSKTYDGTTASAGASATRTAGTLAGTDTIAFAYAATSSANAGTYPGLATTTISNVVAPLTRTGSYAITNAGNYTISKAAQAAVTITSSPTVNYGTPYTATAAGGNGTGALVWALGTGSTASGAAINSSTGVITANSSGTVVINVNRAADTNYNVSATTANFTVTVAKVAITVTLSGTKAYNATTASTGAAATITSGALVSGDTIGYVYAATGSANAGTYTGLTTATISNTVAPTTRTTSYTITYAGSYTITKIAQAAVTISSAATGTYGTAYTATATGGTGTGALVWALGTGSTATGAAINASTGAITANSSGTVVINVYRAADTNYNASATTANCTVTFAKRLITVTLSGTKPYNGTTASTGASAAITTGTLGATDTIGYAYASTSSSAPGTYSGLVTTTVSNVTAPTNRTANYTITAAGTFTITKAAQAAVTITSAATATYGTTYTATASGGSGTGALVWALGTGSTATGAAINSSTGVITANSSGTVVIKVYRALDANYNVSATTADFTVTVAKRAITVTLAGSKTYNGTTASTGASATLTAGTLAGTDTIGYAYAAAGSANAGSYPGLATATVSNTVAPTARSGSYTITYAGSYTINPAATTFSLSPTSFFYNGAVRTPTVVPVPVGATFTPGGVLSATSIGSYIGTAAATGNYSGTNNNLTWSILADTTAPTVPTGLAVSNPTTTSFTLTWTASTDNVGVTLYTIYQNGVSIGTSATPTFNVTGLTASTTYNMTVTAQDGVPNVSAPSAPLAVTTLTDSSGVPVTGMRLWLRADLGVTVGTGGVQSWADQSTGGNNAYQPGSTSERPQLVANAVNGQSVIRFDGVDDYLRTPFFMAGATQGEVFVIAKLPTFASRDDGMWAFGGGDGTETEIISGARHLTEDFGRSYRTDAGVPVVPLTDYVIYNVSASTNDWTVRLNGLTQVHLTDNVVGFGSSPILGFAVGKRLQGDIAEVIAYDHVLTPAERGAVNGYLTTKYVPGGLVAPPQPTLGAMTTSTTDAALSWTAPPIGTFTSTLERQQGAGAWTVVNTADNVTSYADTGLTPSQVYSYRVKNSNTAGVSAYSAVVTVTMPADGSSVPTTGMRIWLRADLGIGLDGLGAVQSWTDQSGGGNDAAQVATTARPQYVPSAVNGRPVIRFDGVDDTLNLPFFMGGATQGELFVMVKLPNFATRDDGMWALGGGGDGTGTATSSGTRVLTTDFGKDYRANIGPPVVPLTDYVIFNVSAATNDWTIRLNGQTQFHTTTNTVGFGNGTVLGFAFGSMLQGDIAEVIAYDHVLTVAERGAVGGYLAAKYVAGGLAAPGQPSLGAMATSYTSMALSWTSPALGNYTTTVERQQGAGAWTVLATLANATSYPDTGLTSGLTYSYRVKNTNATGDSAYSAVVSVMAPLNVNLPPGLRMWLRADLGVVLDVNGVMSTWLDQSSAHNNASALYPVWAPQLAANAMGLQPAVRFDGVNSRVELPNFMSGATQGEIFVVARLKDFTNPTNGLVLIGGNQGTVYGATQVWNDFGTSDNIPFASPGASVLTQPHIFGSSMAANYTMIVQFNNVELIRRTEGYLGFRSDPVLGATFNGDIAEVIAYDHVLSAADHITVISYLTTKYSIGAPVPSITSPLTATAAINVPLSPNYTITATNSPTSYNASGLPAGLSVNPTTGVISGTPTASGTTNVTISATNANGTGTATLVFTVNPSTVPAITSALTLNGLANLALSPTYTITATNSPTSYNATGLPAGLSVNTTTGVISGTPTAVGTTNVTISATNASGTGSVTLTVNITLAAPSITSVLTKSATVNVPLSPVYTITASNFPTSFNATGLPAGLSINTVTGVISGTPTAAGNTNVTISATNATGTGSATLVISVSLAGAPAITSALTKSGTVNVALSPTYAITASNTPTSYNATGLPAGLSVNTGTGVISGTPTAIATTNVTISATNAIGTDSATLVITINPAGTPVISSSLTKSGTINTPLSPTYTITASNSPTSFNATGLPAGLSVNTGSGVISGTPTALGVTNVTISATNALGTGTAILAITVNPIATTFALNTASFIYNGTPRTVTVVPTPGAATFSPGGTLTATAIGAYTATATATGNYSGTNNSLTWSIVPDTTPPSAPTALVGGSLTATGFTLTWTASTDNVGVTGYTIYQNGVAVGTSTTPIFTLAGLTAATSYNMTVKAQDQAGNLSAASTVLPVTTLDPNAPIPTTGLRTWLRADSGVTVDGSNGVSTWTDQSAAHNDATQTTAVWRPTLVAAALNGKPVLRFYAPNNNNLVLPNLMNGATQGEIFIVAKLKDYSSRSNALCHLGGGLGTIYGTTTNQLWNDFGTPDNTPTVAPPPSALIAPHIFNSSVTSTGTMVVQLNNVEFLRRTGENVFFRADPLLGADHQNEYFNGDIAEVIIYDHVLTTAERAGVDAYLTAKYALPSPLNDPNGDADGDGLTNAQELNLYHTNPYLIDTDADGLPDGYEVAAGLNPLVNDAGADLDGDGVPNQEDARPTNPAIGRLTITIVTPPNGS